MPAGICVYIAGFKPDSVDRFVVFFRQPAWIRSAVVVGLAFAILVASVVDPGEGGTSTVFGIGVTVYTHVLAYGALSVAIGYARLSADRRTLVIAVVVATAYGALIELLQGMIPYRTMSALDAVLNAMGATIGAVVWRVVFRRFGGDIPEPTSL